MGGDDGQILIETVLCTKHICLSAVGMHQTFTMMLMVVGMSDILPSGIYFAIVSMSVVSWALQSGIFFIGKSF